MKVEIPIHLKTYGKLFALDAVIAEHPALAMVPNFTQLMNGSPVTIFAITDITVQSQDHELLMWFQLKYL